jgi:hypothetical protein
MEGLSWDSFRQQAQATICANCSCGSRAPWRGNATCLQAWLRYHATRGITLSCHSAEVKNDGRRLEDQFMKVYPTIKQAG